jgi:hypothetical protein
MTGQSNATFSSKKGSAERQKRTSATTADGEEDKHILASRYKTKMCKNFVAKGECPYEVRCMFAHGEKELRTSEDNIRDGLVTEEAIKAFQRQQNQAKRRATYAAAREAEARTSAATMSIQPEMYLDAEEPHHEELYLPHQDAALNAPSFIPHTQSLQHVAGYYVHNPYAFDIIPAEAREFAVYEEVPEEAAYWYEEPVEQDYYFPSSDMMVPLVPSSAVQTQQQYSTAANKMYDSVNADSLSEEAPCSASDSSDYATYAPAVHCTAAEMPSFSDEVPMVLEP